MKKVIISLCLLVMFVACGSSITTENEKFKDITVVKKAGANRLLDGYKVDEIYLFTIKSVDFKNVYGVSGIFKQNGKYYSLDFVHTGTPENMGLVQSIGENTQAISGYPNSYGGRLEKIVIDKNVKLLNEYVDLFAKEKKIEIEF